MFPVYFDSVPIEYITPAKAKKPLASAFAQFSKNNVINILHDKFCRICTHGAIFGKPQKRYPKLESLSIPCKAGDKPRFCEKDNIVDKHTFFTMM